MRRVAWALTAFFLGCGGGDNVGGQADTDDAGDGELPEAEGHPPPASLKKLRSWEYRNSVAQLLGEAVTVHGDLPPDFVRASFSSIAAAQDAYEDLAVEGFETIALDIAAQAFTSEPNPMSALGCTPSDATDPCVREFVADFGLRAWRRPLTDAELDKYVGLIASLAAIYGADVLKGSELAVAAMVQSPYFLYRVELGTPVDGGGPEVRKYTPHEMATRLSFTLWEQPPDAALLAAAAAGELATADSVREHAERMLADDRAIAPIFRFWREHLSIDRLTLTNYPRAEASETLYAGLREEGRFMAYHLALPGADALSYLDTQRAYLQPDVAAIYGMDLATEAEVEMPAERAGFLTSGIFLVSNSHPGKTSPTRRGKFILERVLCRSVPPPPADVDLELPTPLPGEATGRQALDQHSSDPSCAACHVQLDPPGFAFEHFGPTAALRGLDNGLPVDASGALDGEDFQDAAGLIELLRKSPDAARCVTLQTFRSTLGAVETIGQAQYIASLQAGFVDSEHDQRQLIVDIVSSDAFRFATGFSGGQ